MELKFKILKQSTYNALMKQSQLKDQIISAKEKYGNEITEKLNKQVSKYKLLYDEHQEALCLIEKLKDKNSVLDMARLDAIQDLNELREKHSRINQPRYKGKFTSKRKG